MIEDSSSYLADYDAKSQALYKIEHLVEKIRERLEESSTLFGVSFCSVILKFVENKNKEELLKINERLVPEIKLKYIDEKTPYFNEKSYSIPLSFIIKNSLNRASIKSCIINVDNYNGSKFNNKFT